MKNAVIVSSTLRHGKVPVGLTVSKLAEERRRCLSFMDPETIACKELTGIERVRRPPDVKVTLVVDRLVLVLKRGVVEEH